VEDRTRELGKRKDYFFTNNVDSAAYWETEEEAAANCKFLDDSQIVIDSPEGGQHIGKGFQVEQRAPDEFVIFCYAPFIIREKQFT
jgi:hypothetical protein